VVIVVFSFGAALFGSGLVLSYGLSMAHTMPNRNLL